MWGDYDRNIYYNPDKCGATLGPGLGIGKRG